MIDLHAHWTEVAFWLLLGAAAGYSVRAALAVAQHRRTTRGILQRGGRDLDGRRR